MGMHFRDNDEKITIGMIVSGIIIIGILLTSLILYLLNVNSSKINEGIIENKQIAKSQDNTEEFEDVSIEIGKSVNEAINEISTNNVVNTNTENKTNLTTSNTNTTTNAEANTGSTSSSKSLNETNKTDEKSTAETTAKVAEKEKDEKDEKTNIKFIEPIKGEIIREFAPDSLVYSETLKEWVTHNGVDIKADKASVVVAAYDGKVSAIKNDPRYGLTVIIEHENGYKTIYANLLTAEYVVEGEEVTAGQTIGTIGNSANFEIADDYHLHFEIMKDGEYINPLQ